jgi:Xaa-Pro dipeptidase
VLGALAGAALFGCRRPIPPIDVPAHRTRVVDPGPEGHPEFAGLVGLCDGVPAIAPDEHLLRQDDARVALRAHGLQALVAEAGDALHYFTGVRWGRSERPLLWVLPVQGPATWVGPSFEENTLRELIGPAAALRVWHEHEPPYLRVREALAALPAAAPRVGVEPTARMFVLEGLRQHVPSASFVDGGPTVRACRTLKRATELALLRRANEATKAALRAVADHGTREGMLESELAARVRLALETAGLGDVWALVLFGPNAAYPHGTRGEHRLVDGDLVLVDAGGSLHGYRSDITRTWPFGHVTDEARRAYAAVLDAQTAALAAIRPGATCGAVDAAARAVIAAAGYGPGDRFFTHRLGHGIGLETHEDPYLVQGSQVVLAANMTMSNEPGIYVPGKLGVRIEDILAVTKDGAEVFGPRALSIEQPFGE